MCSQYVKKNQIQIARSYFIAEHTITRNYWFPWIYKGFPFGQLDEDVDTKTILMNRRYTETATSATRLDSDLYSILPRPLCERTSKTISSVNSDCNSLRC